VGKISPLYTYSIPNAAVTANLPTIDSMMRMIVVVGSSARVAVADRDATAPSKRMKMMGFLLPNLFNNTMDKRYAGNSTAPRMTELMNTSPPMLPADSEKP
jgi:hypothetical protein